MTSMPAPEVSVGDAADTRVVTDGLTALSVTLRGRGASVSNLRRLTGGASMQTWSFSLTSKSGVEELILRRGTASSHSATTSARGVDLTMEAALMRAASAQGASIPEVVHVCDPAEPLGEGHLTRRVYGETLGGRIVRDAKFADVRDHLARQCGETAARVHAAHVSNLDLPFEDATATLDRYESTYRAMSTARPVFELAFNYLRANVPSAEPSTLVHGDFRNGNLIIDEQRGVAALLDWELSHVGDPAEDLAYVCVNSWRYGATQLPVGGFGTREQLLDGYRAAGGREIRLERLHFWELFGSLKWGVICLELYSTWVSGTDRSVERAMIGRRVTETEIDMLALLREVTP